MTPAELAAAYERGHAAGFAAGLAAAPGRPVVAPEPSTGMYTIREPLPRAEGFSDAEREILRLALAGQGVRGIVSALAAAGVRGPRGGAWGLRTVQVALVRLRAAGHLPPVTRGPGWRLGQRDETRRAEILAAVETHGGNLTAAAKELGLTTGRVSQVVASSKKVNACLDTK